MLEFTNRRIGCHEADAIKERIEAIEGHLLSVASNLTVTSTAVEQLGDKIDRLTQFAIPPQQHYDEHQDLRLVLELFKLTHSMVVRAILGLVIIGGTFLAGVGIFVKWWK